MPPFPVAQALTTSLPWISSRARAVIYTLVSLRGVNLSAGEMARRLGLGTRFQLVRLLHDEGLPGFSRLNAWTYLLQMLWDAEHSRLSLASLSRRARVDVPRSYRLCKRVLGVPWSVAHAQGWQSALIKFLACCQRPGPIVGPAPTIAPSPDFQIMRRPDRVGVGRALARSASRSLRHPRGELGPRVLVPHAPTDVAVSPGGVVYATRAHAATVERLDLAARKAARSISVECNPTRLTFCPSGRFAYVTNQFSDSISVIDMSQERCIDQIPLNGNPAPVIVTRDERRLYVTTNADVLYAIDLPSKRVAGTIALPAASHHMTMNPQGSRLYVATRSAGTVLEVDAQSCQLRRTFHIGGQTQGLALSADGNDLFVADEAGGLSVVDVARGVVHASLLLRSGAYGLALTPDNAQIYVGLAAEERVQVIDRASLRVARTIGTGGVPRMITFTKSGKYALIANEAGWIDVVT